MRLTMHGCYRAVDTVSLVSNVADGSFTSLPTKAETLVCPLWSESDHLATEFIARARFEYE